MNTLFISIMLPAFEFIKIKKKLFFICLIIFNAAMPQSRLNPFVGEIVKISLLKRKKSLPVSLIPLSSRSFELSSRKQNHN